MGFYSIPYSTTASLVRCATMASRLLPTISSASLIAVIASWRVTLRDLTTVLIALFSVIVLSPVAIVFVSFTMRQIIIFLSGKVNSFLYYFQFIFSITEISMNRFVCLARVRQGKIFGASWRANLLVCCACQPKQPKSQQNSLFALTSHQAVNNTNFDPTGLLRLARQTRQFASVLFVWFDKSPKAIFSPSRTSHNKPKQAISLGFSHVCFARQQGKTSQLEGFSLCLA